MTTPADPLSADLPSIPASPRPWRALFNGFLFLAACAAGCALLGRLAPFPEVPGIYPKWSYFRENRDQVDVLFVGSSRFYHQIIPAQFDAAVGEGKSFNFGYDGMWPPESFYLLRQLLKLHPARLKWVVIDLMDINTQLDDRNDSTLRMAYWHDLRHTALAFREILSSGLGWQRKNDLLWQHGHLCISQVLNLGRGSEMLGGQLITKKGVKKVYSWENAQGYEEGPDRQLEGKQLESYLRTVERLKKGLPGKPVRPVFRQALSEIIADVRKIGAEPIFVIAPTINERENFTEVPDGATVFSLNQPNEHPEFFDPAKHYDAWHLNGKGAVDFTKVLSDRFLERTKGKP